MVGCRSDIEFQFQYIFYFMIKMSYFVYFHKKSNHIIIISQGLIMINNLRPNQLTSMYSIV